MHIGSAYRGACRAVHSGMHRAAFRDVHKTA